MFVTVIGSRQYRSNGKRSLVSGRLIDAEYQNDFGVWKKVKNWSRIEEIDALMSAHPATVQHNRARPN